MAKGTQSTALRALLACLGIAALALGTLRLLTPLDLGLLLVIYLLIWKGFLDPLSKPALANEKFWTLFNGSSDAVFIRDDSNFMGSNPFMEANDMACRRLGYTREELLAMNPRDLAPVAEESRVEEVRRALEEKGHAVFESPIRTKDGQVYPAEIHVHHMKLGGKSVILSMLRDITARKQTEELMRRLSQAVEQSPVSILITDIEGTIIFVTKRVQEITGFTAEELIGQNPRILNSGNNPPELFVGLWAAITAGKVWTGEIQNRRKSGEIFWEHATVAPISDARGVTTHFMSFMEDITGHRQMQDQLRHSQKLEAVGQLAGGVAHDLNNILQVINGYATLIQLTMPAQDSSRNPIGEILKAAERAAHLTHSLLAFSRKQIMNPKIGDLNAVVGSVDKFLRRVIGEDIQLQLRCSDTPLPVLVDVPQMEQVLMNLATNARDAMPTGGTLTISTDWLETGAQVDELHTFFRTGRYARVTVTDTGVGMDAATQKRIFDPFFTTKAMGRATGLGLSTVYGIIKQLGGYILVQSEPGVGSTFQIYLPLVQQARAVGREQPLPEPPAKGTETILVAEDEPVVRGMIEMVLEKYGYQVLLAEDGQEAVEQFKTHRDTIKLILMDIIMPRKGGRQAFEEIRALDPAVKVLFTSGYTADFIQSRGDLDEEMELLMKPVQPLDLLRRIRTLLDRPLPTAVG